MDIKIQDLQKQISEQKALAGINFFGAFRDGYLAALDIINTFVKAHEVKNCLECRVELNEEEKQDGDMCDKCYVAASGEHHAESMRNR